MVNVIMALALGSALAAYSAPGASADDLTRYRLDAGGYARDYYVHAGPTVSGRPLPVVLVLHGLGGDAVQALHDYGWAREAEAEHFLVVGLDALPPDATAPASPRNPRFWNTGNPDITGPTSRYDDVGYVRAVVADVEAHFPVDRSRIYATGFSSGAGMVHRLGIEMSETLAAVAAVASLNFQTAPPARPLSVLMIFGKLDPLVPYDGGERRLPWSGRSVFPPVSDTVAHWTRDLGCSPPSSVVRRPGEERRTWPHCNGGSEVSVMTIDGIGHRWAGETGDPLPNRLVGPRSDAIDDTRVIWRFFARHPQLRSGAARACR